MGSDSLKASPNKGKAQRKKSKQSRGLFGKAGGKLAILDYF